MKQTTTLKGQAVKFMAKVAVAGPWRAWAEGLTCALGRKRPTSRLVLSFCRHLGSQLLEREGTRFERIADLASGGRMSCTGLNGVSTTGIMYYFLGTINGQTEDERPIEHLLRRAVRPGDTFMDIGANYGFYSFLLGPICGKSGAIHAFEANPVLRQHLLRSVELNRGTANIIINTIAIGSVNKDEVILYDPERIGCSSLHQHEWVDAKTSVSVPQITIDDYCRKNNLRRIDVIKIDIEGAELDAFRGMDETLVKCAPALIICELMPLMNTTTDEKNQTSEMRRAESAANPMDIVDLLAAKGYEPRAMTPDGRLGAVVDRERIRQLARNIINVSFTRKGLEKTRPELFAQV